MRALHATVGTQWRIAEGDPGSGNGRGPGFSSLEGIAPILEAVSVATGLELAHFRFPPLARAVAQAMRLAGFSDPGLYLGWLKAHPEQLRGLGTEILNRTTRFFRDPDEFAALDRDVIEPLVRSRMKDGPIRIWVAGCATGEEAYSIGILLLERLGEADLVPPCRILATDVSPAVLGRARAGIYPARALRGLSPERLERFFLPVNGHYRVVQPLRNLCVFSRRDVAFERHFTRLDLISCRNILIYLIYLTPEARRRTLDRFFRALKPGGFLFLGRGETPNEYSRVLKRVNRHAIYRKA